jgi:hypothetical protein
LLFSANAIQGYAGKVSPQDEQSETLRTAGSPVPPAQGKPPPAEPNTSEEVEVAMGDDGGGVVGSDAPIQSAGFDAGED